MLIEKQIETLFERLKSASPEPVAPQAKTRKTAFQSLVSVMLSAQSRDAMTAKASAKLFKRAATPQAILKLADDELRTLIKDAGLYNMKAKNIKAMCKDLLTRFDGIVPDNRQDLMSLPGVGRKSADIMLRFTFDQPYVAVDTHVFRLTSRMGLAQGKTEAQLARDLEPKIPTQYRMGAHMWLLNHGKYVCLARAPRCAACNLSDLCMYNAKTLD